MICRAVGEPRVSEKGAIELIAAGPAKPLGITPPDLTSARPRNSDQALTGPVATLAVDRRVAPIDDQNSGLGGPLRCCGAACVGRFLLWDLDDPSGARPYLEAAFDRGNSEAAIDLSVIALLGA